MDNNKKNNTFALFDIYLLFVIMRHSLALFFLVLLSTAMKAQEIDAFHGILPVTDPALKRSLNGQWHLKVIEGIDESKGNVPELNDTWGRIDVPGCWEEFGFCQPSYDNANPLTGYYRTLFTIPEDWKGLRIAIRLDGVLYGYDLYVDGHYAGSWQSAYNTTVFDITDCLDLKKTRHATTHSLALRVITQFPGSDFDYNDDWAPAGIFRNVTLMAVPATHLSDLTINAKSTGEMEVCTDIANNKKGTMVRQEVIDAQGQVIAVGHQESGVSLLSVAHPHLWTAETPYLYTLRTTLLQKDKPLQTFEHRFGFRDITIDGNVLKINGQPVKLRGVTCHSTDPVSVKVISDELTQKDMRLMKEASVNYIRTSHYPREPRFYELADSLGFYIIDEIPFGYGDRNLYSEEFYPTLQQRAEATVKRDKNHPSVIIWSVGNENPLTDICIRLGRYLADTLDTTRPYCYPQIGSYFRHFFDGKDDKGFPSNAPIYAPHYPTTDQIAGFYQHLDKPVIFTEYCHTLGISFEDHDRQWEIIQHTPGIAGGSVWEWVDQGMPFKEREGLSKRYGYAEKVYTTPFSGFEMYGNKGTDGLLYADRTPLPNYYELQHNYARAFVDLLCYDSLTHSVRFSIHNRYDFLNLKDHVSFQWSLTTNRDTIARGAFSPDCKPHDTVDYMLQLPSLQIRTQLNILHLTLTDEHGHVFLRQSFPLNNITPVCLGTGDVTALWQEGPLVRAGRKPTLAENVTQKDRLPEKYLLPIDNTQVRAKVERKKIEGGEELTFDLIPDSTDLFRAELGLAFLLDSSIDRFQWIGNGPYPSYPGRHQANRYGIWAKHKDDLYFEGNRMGIDTAVLTDSLGNGVLITGDSLSLNMEQTDCGLVLTVNAAVAGQGPKFQRTAFPVDTGRSGTVTGHFRIVRVSAIDFQKNLQTLFCPPNEVPAPLRPYITQYDTYLMRYSDIR